MEKRNVFVRFMAALWRGVDGFRKVLHLLLLLLVFGVFFGALSGTTPSLPGSGALLIQPAGALVEQLEGDPYDRAVEEVLGEENPQTVVQDVIDALEFAKNDDRITAVHLDVGGLGTGGLSKLRRIADAIEDFKTSGKPVIASADFMTQQGYYLAAHADEVYMHPEGLLLMQGYGRFRDYFSDAIGKLRLDWNIFRVGTYKSFIEPYTRMDMSDADREATLHLIDQLWSMYREDVVAARGLEEGAIDDFTTNYLDYVREADGDIAAAVLKHGLVDGLLTRTDIRERLIEEVGEDRNTPGDYSFYDQGSYLAQMRLLQGSPLQAENVAVIVASGEIMFGSQPPGTIGAESTGSLLRRALADDSVKAVVLQVDSPGGSSFASDVIAHEVQALRDANKPVVASMSSTAASGGYWISVGADRIFANPSTVTGSIGIFGMFPTYQRTIEVLGITTDGVGSTPWAGEFRPDREMSAHAKELFQLAIEDGYDDFITKVAEYRNMDKDAVDNVAQGRVWTGVDALEFGLVDELGTVDDAVSAAAEIAGLEEGGYGRKYIYPELTPTEQFIVDMLSAGSRVGIDPPGFLRSPSSVERLASRLDEFLAPLTRWNDPRGIYAHCLCTFE